MASPIACAAGATPLPASCRRYVAAATVPTLLVARLPARYRRCLEIVSEPGKDGVGSYAELGGAAAHGSQDYLDMIPPPTCSSRCTKPAMCSNSARPRRSQTR